MCRSMVEIQSVAAEIRLGKKRKKKDRNHRMKIYMVSLLHRATITSMFPHYPAVFIFTSVHSVILGLLWQSLWLQVWAHLWCNRGWIMPTPLCMLKLQSAQNSLTRVVLPSLRHLSASEWLSYLHWLSVNYRIQFKIATLTYKILATCQPCYLYNLLQVYHHELSVHQPNNFSMYHICLLILVSVHSATALLQHGTPFLSPSKTAHLCIVSSIT